MKLSHWILKAVAMTLLGHCVTEVKAGNLTIQPRFTNSFRFAATDAWNLDLQFQSSSGLHVYLTADIAQGGKKVATLQSENVLIQPGIQSFTSVSLATSQIKYHSQAISDIESLTGSWPSGNYKICYTVNCTTADCDGLGADALFNETSFCYEFVIEPPTPLLLATPEDKAELEWARPNFNWIPPMPLSSVNGFHYLYTLVEKQKGQNCNDAIVRNRPLYKQSGIELPALTYPAELNDLDTGKKYCWKVDGLVGDIPVAQSEVWEFKLKPEIKEIRQKAFVELSQSPSTAAYRINIDDTLSIVFTEQYNSDGIDNWDIALRQEGDPKQSKIDDITLTAVYTGAGNICLTPWEFRGKIKTNVTYLLKLQNVKKEIFIARIQFYKKNEN